jgi:alkanesulfonate monooxygenase SsuD/methylene tetrahydromethanopterin reductase-like flavin-dependent oxidoreductase (luciferase family)
MVTAMPYRNPAVLAKMVATIDHASGGRLDLGLGAGWYDDEAIAYGMPLLPIGRRLAQFEEGCGVVTSLLTTETTTFAGRYYELEEARCEPKPLQKPYPPILMGGVGEKRFLKIVAHYADDWNYPGGTAADFKHKLAVLHSHCGTLGRDPSTITPSCHIYVTESAAQTADQAAEFVEAGARHICLYFQDNTKAEAIGPTADAVVRAARQR